MRLDHHVQREEGHAPGAETHSACVFGEKAWGCV